MADKKVYMDIGGKKIEVDLIPAADYQKKGPTVDNKDFIKSEKENQQRMPRGIKIAFKGGGRAYGNNS